MAIQVPEAVISGEGLTRYASSRFAERGFCKDCGTHIYHRPKDGPELAISAGLFEDPDMFVAREIFADSNPPFYRFEANSIKRSGLSMAFEWGPKLLWRTLASWWRRPR